MAPAVANLAAVRVTGGHRDWCPSLALEPLVAAPDVTTVRAGIVAALAVEVKRTGLSVSGVCWAVRVGALACLSGGVVSMVVRLRGRRPRLGGAWPGHPGRS